MAIPDYTEVMSENLPNLVRFMTREEFDEIQRQAGEISQSYPERPVRLTKKEFDRRRVAEVFEDAFELIGGVSRLAVWAHENPTEFFKLYGRMLPTGTSVDLNQKGEITFKHVLPPTKLDKEPENG